VRTGEKALAKGRNHPPEQKRRIEPAPAEGDEPPKGRERELDQLVSGPAPRRGRPALPAEQGKRHPLGIRTTKALREALLSASRASGRSLAQEIELRLERSIEDQQRLGEALELAFGRETAALVLAMGCAIKMTVTLGLFQSDTSKWTSNSFVFSQAVSAIETLVYAIKPEENPPTLPSWAHDMWQAVLLGHSKFRQPWERYLEMLPDIGKHQGKMVARAIVYPDRVAAGDGHSDDQTLENLFLGPWGPMIRNWLGEAAVARIKEVIDQSDRLEVSERKNR
jgi:hypothetical protein